ncbi:MAG: Holliday junction endonuclease [Pseudomonadota bacterium]
MFRVVGIDPGQQGGVACLGHALHLRDDEPRFQAKLMPYIAKEFSAKGLQELVAAYKPDLLVVEHAQPMPKQGVTSMFNYGRDFGKILAVCELAEIPWQLVRPPAWKKRVLAGTARDKNAAINHVRHRYPWVDLTPGRRTKPHDGIADAVCIAEWGVKELLRGGDD